MLPRSARLRKERDHEHVRRTGRRASDQFLSVKALQTQNTRPRVAVVISKKVDKRATVRNRIRRQILAKIEQKYKKLKPGTDIVVIIRPGISALTSKDAEIRMFSLFRQLSLIA
jgi:ribonuclease P protein component